MRNAKQEIKLCIKITVCSIVAFILVQFELYKNIGLYNCIIESLDADFLHNLKLFVITIASGVFVSAFLTLIISIKNYKSQKKRLLDEIYLKSTDIINEIFKIRLLEFDRSFCEVLEIIDEEQENDSYKVANAQIIEMTKKWKKKKRKEFIKEHYFCKDDVKIKVKKQIIDDLPIYSKRVIEKKETLESYAEKEYQKALNNYYNIIDSAIKSFAEYKSWYCHDLTLLMLDVDFFKKETGRKINEKLYRKLHAQIGAIRKVGSICDSYLNSEKFDRRFLMQEIAYVQKTMIDKKDRLTYNHFAYDIETELDKLLALGAENSCDEDEDVLYEKDFWVSSGCYLGEYVDIEGLLKIEDGVSDKKHHNM